MAQPPHSCTADDPPWPPALPAHARAVSAASSRSPASRAMAPKHRGITPHSPENKLLHVAPADLPGLPCCIRRMLCSFRICRSALTASPLLSGPSRVPPGRSVLCHAPPPLWTWLTHPILDKAASGTARQRDAPLPGDPTTWHAHHDHSCTRCLVARAPACSESR